MFQPIVIQARTSKVDQMSQRSPTDRLRQCQLCRPAGSAVYYIVGCEKREDVIELLGRLCDAGVAHLVRSKITPFNEIIYMEIGGHKVTMVFEDELSFHCDDPDDSALEFVATAVRNALLQDNVD